MNDNFRTLSTISERVFDKEASLGFRRLSEPEQVFYCVWALSGLVGNGGFAAFLLEGTSSTSKSIFSLFRHARRPWFEDFVHALRAIGANDTARLVQSSGEIFPGGSPPHDFSKREKLWNKLFDETSSTAEMMEQRLDALDTAFYSEHDKKVGERLYRYVLDHPTSFPEVQTL